MSRHSRIELVPALIDHNRTAGSAKRHGDRWREAPIGPIRSAKATEPHYLRLVAGNGQVLATSELYANKANAKRATIAWDQAFYDISTGGRAVVEVDS